MLRTSFGLERLLDLWARRRDADLAHLIRVLGRSDQATIDAIAAVTAGL